MLDLSLFRHAPHAFKPNIYRDQQWLFQQRIETRRGPAATKARAFADAAFLREFANRVTRGDDAPVYTLLHVLTPHLQITTDADCAYAPKPEPIREDFANQVRCAVSAVRTLLQRLLDLDLYDRSAIIVTSDHGFDLPWIEPEDEHPLRGMRSPAGVTLPWIESRATPLLLVKPFAAQDPLQISYAPTAITDVPATLLDLAGLSPTRWEVALPYCGSIPQSPGSARTHTTGRAPDRTASSISSTSSRSTDRSGTQTPGAITGRYSGPTDDRAAQRREHQVGLSADPDDTADDSGDRTYRTDGYAVFHAAAEESHVTFDVRRMPGMATTQTVTVRIDGDIVDQHVLVDDAWHTLSYPVEARSEASPFCIELLTSPVWYDATGESWGLMLRGDI